ncbi:hypothetical protein ACQ86D_37685 [Streptomyces galilaeus]
MGSADATVSVTKRLTLVRTSVLHAAPIWADPCSSTCRTPANTEGHLH